MMIPAHHGDLLTTLLSLLIFGIWTTPRTWVAGELVTASMLNVQLRDNLNYLYATLSSTGVFVSVYNDTTQAIGHASDTYFTYNSEDADASGFHSTASLTGRLTVPAGLDGSYLMIGYIFWDSIQNSTTYVFLRKNGSTKIRQPENWGSDSSGHGQRALSFTSLVTGLVAGDYLELGVNQDSGGSINTGSTNAETMNRLSLVKV